MPKQKLHIIYIPGLGDRNPKYQRLAVRAWRMFGVSSELFHVDWHDKKDFAPKFSELRQAIAAARMSGHAVGLVCASAGGTAAMQAYADTDDRIAGVVCIAAKINNPQAVGDWYKKSSPAFWQAMQSTPAALTKLDQSKRRRIRSVYALFDPIVPARDSKISGAQNRRSLSVGHAFTIALQLTVGAWSNIAFLKRTATEVQ